MHPLSTTAASSASCYVPWLSTHTLCCLLSTCNWEVCKAHSFPLCMHVTTASSNHPSQRPLARMLAAEALPRERQGAPGGAYPPKGPLCSAGHSSPGEPCPACCSLLIQQASALLVCAGVAVSPLACRGLWPACHTGVAAQRVTLHMSMPGSSSQHESPGQASGFWCAAISIWQSGGCGVRPLQIQVSTWRLQSTRVPCRSCINAQLLQSCRVHLLVPERVGLLYTRCQTRP